MAEREKKVDGFRFLPPGLAAWVRKFIPDEDFKGHIPWTPMKKALGQTTLALVTSAGISLRTDPPFDMGREKREAIWGDRSYRAIPRGTTEKDIEVNHLHINTNDIQQDINVMLPLARMAEFEQEKIIGRLTPTAYSFYGFQWENTDFLKEAIEPISKKVKHEGAEAVLITRGSKGMVLFERRRPPLVIPIYGSTDIVDVTGAGDTVISVFTLALTCGATFKQAAQLANYAGGIVVMKKGTATLSPQDLKEAIGS